MKAASQALGAAMVGIFLARLVAVAMYSLGTFAPQVITEKRLRPRNKEDLPVIIKKTFESGLLIGGSLGACTVMFALAACVGLRLVMGFGAVAIVAGVAAIALISRTTAQRGLNRTALEK